MKRFFTLFTGLLILVLVPGFLFAQERPDYTVQLQAGKFIPVENINTVSKSSPVFTNSFFNGNYYLTIQFKSLPSWSVREHLKASGIELMDYLPNLSYTAIVDNNASVNVMKNADVRSVYQLTPEQKTATALFKGEMPAHSIKVAGHIDVTVITYERIPVASIAGTLNIIEATVLEDNPHFRSFVIRVPIDNLKKIAELPFVQWVEPINPQPVMENLPGRTLHRVNVLNDGFRNLKGDGINVGIWDGGAVSPHLDFSPAGRLTLVEGGGVVDHSTHCAGTICGKGLINPVAQGMAPNANIFSWNFNGNVQTEMTAGIPANNLMVSSHSYGFTYSGACSFNNPLSVYDGTSRSTDLVLNNFPFHLQVHSAGNAGQSCAGGFFTITGSGKPAKNNLVVGALTTSDGITSFSSSGPVQDGRIKPEICAFGNNVFSTSSNPLNGYTTMSGTSMSTPGVAGASILLYQRYKQLTTFDAPSMLIKNIICNGAHDLGNAGPDYRYGFGRINALTAVRILEDSRYILNTVATGGSVDEVITIPANTVRLRVMLTWNDPAAAANSNPALINNLDLTVVNGATTTLPWTLDKNNPSNLAVRAVDNISNIEQVTIDNPPAGSYTLRVAGTAVPTGPNQAYSLTWIIDPAYMEVLYPNGGEFFNPGASETITWDNAGVTSNQTVEYSLNNGSSWNTIATVGATITRQVWSVPAANTSQALIRITSGAISDISDANFTIFGAIVSGFAVNGSSCTAGDISFIWNPVTDATHYDIYRLNEVTGNFVILSSNIVGTSHTASGLTPGATMWFYIVAKNNTTGTAGPRSNAISGVVSSGGGGLGTMGAISGQSTVCGSPVAEPYSVAPVAGATTYTWTAPPGATVASGQGTPNITINYSGGSSGNVSVFASNGSCQTSTSTLPVTVGPGSVAAPLSGGDQTATACPPTPIPTLTATATVPTGHTVVWYSAATGGSIVASPTLNSIGTVTYHAASRNNSSGCESSVRTPVTLTINAAPPPTITAAGPITFCQGGSVVLTANAGVSYLWSTGATSQSITVSTSGTYSVTITQSGGCVGTSPNTTVTVNPVPVANITAGGPLAFCSGNSVILTASSGASWLWSNGATTQAITVTNSGTFTVTVTNASGCSASSTSVTTAVSPSPSVVITANPYTRLFPGLMTTLTAVVTPPGTYTYSWFKNGVSVPGGTTSTLTGIDLDDLGSYTVTVTNTTGLPCAGTSPALAIGDSATTRLFIYPSPNAGEFKVTYYTPGNTQNTIVVFDSKGAMVYRRSHTITAPYQRLDVDMRRNSKGLYRVVLFDKNGKKLADGSVVLQ